MNILHSVVLLLGIVPQSPAILSDRVDVIELNHFYDCEHGRLVFDQLIFKSWDGTRHQVRAWRLVKQPSQIPTRDPAGGYSVTWLDGDDVRRVWAKSYVESWTQDDPELAEREILPKEQRRELTRR